MFDWHKGDDKPIVDFLIHNLHPNPNESHFLFAT